MSVLHVTSETEGEEGRLGQVKVNVASHIVLCELEFRVECGARVCRNDTGLVVHTENEAVAEKFSTTADICADVGVCREVIGHEVKPVGGRIEVRIDTVTSVLDLQGRERMRHSRQFRCCIHNLHVLCSVNELGNLQRCCDSIVCLDVDLCLSDRAALGLDHYRSVGSAHTIDGCSGSVLED